MNIIGYDNDNTVKKEMFEYFNLNWDYYIKTVPIPIDNYLIVNKVNNKKTFS